MAKPLPRIVLDTNVLMVSVSSRSKLYWVYANFLNRKFTLCITTEILAEYAEIFSRHMGQTFCDQTLQAIISAVNTRFISPTYRFQLLADPDDNKFVDCAIAANATCIVSHDRDFLALRDIAFPKVVVVDTAGFQRMLFS